MEQRHLLRPPESPQRQGFTLASVKLPLTSFFPQTPGKATISNDGATILKLLDVVHPAAKTLVDIAKSQDAEVGGEPGCAWGGTQGS